MAQADTGQPVAPTAAAAEASASKDTFEGPDGKERSIDEVENSTEAGMELGLAEGDDLKISEDGQKATWVMSDGQSLIEFNSPKVDGKDASFVFSDGVLTTTVATGGLTTLSCGKSKAVEFGWNILWAGLVCVPMGIGTGGVGGFLCGAAGTGISTFVPWEKVCG